MSKLKDGPGAARVRSPEDVARLLERVAWLMDRAFRIPGTKRTVGLDAILGLVPAVGDVVTGLVQVGLVLVALKHYRVPRTVAARMMANVLLDVGVGTIPILGDLFDATFKANTRNLKLLEPYRAAQVIDVTPEGPGSKSLPGRAARPAISALDFVPMGTLWRYLLPIALVLGGALVLAIIGFVAVVRWLVS